MRPTLSRASVGRWRFMRASDAHLKTGLSALTEVIPEAVMFDACLHARCELHNGLGEGASWAGFQAGSLAHTGKDYVKLSFQSSDLRAKQISWEQYSDGWTACYFIGLRVALGRSRSCRPEQLWQKCARRAGCRAKNAGAFRRE